MGAVTNINGQQITINVSDSIPPQNIATIDKDGLIGNTKSKEQLNEWQEALEDKVSKMSTSGLKGEATPTSSPTPYNPTDYPKGLYEKWEVKTAGTYTNFKDGATPPQPIVITSSDLDKKLAYINVTNGISKKETNDIPGVIVKNVYNPVDNVNPATMKAAADRWDKNNVALKSFIEPLDTTIWEPMDFPDGESDNKYISVNFSEIPSQYAKYGVIQASSLGNVTKMKLKGTMDVFGNGIAWWIGQRPDGSRVVLKSGVISSGVAEIDIDPQFSSYIYSRSKPDSTLEKQPRVLLPVQEDSVKKYIDLMGSGYSGVLDLASLGLKETNTAAQNTSIINSAIESQAGKSDAKHIKFPGGSFAVNEITMKPGTALSGAGRIHTRLYTPVGSAARFIINIQDGQAARGQISDIFIDAENTTEGAIYLNHVYNFNLENMVVYGSKQYLVWIKGGLMHTMKNIYFKGADLGLKTTHMNAFATNLCTYDNIFFVKQIKKCVELNAGSNYRFTSCVFEDSGTSGDESTGGVHAIGLSPFGEGVDVSFNNCWSEGIRGGFVFKIENCYGNSVIRDCMLGNGGNGAGTIANAVVNLNSSVELAGATRFSTAPDFIPFPTNIRAVNGFTFVSSPRINIGTNNVGNIDVVVVQKA